MAVDIFNFLSNGVSVCFDYLDTILNETGMYPYVIGIIILSIFFRLIILPMFGGHIASAGTSDAVKNKWVREHTLTSGDGE